MLTNFPIKLKELYRYCKCRNGLRGIGENDELDKRGTIICFRKVPSAFFYHPHNRNDKFLRERNASNKPLAFMIFLISDFGIYRLRVPFYEICGEPFFLMHNN